MKKIVLFLLLFFPMLITKASPPLLETSEKIVLNAENGAVYINFSILDYNYLQEREVGISPHLKSINIKNYTKNISDNFLTKKANYYIPPFDYSNNSFLTTYKNISYDYNLNKKVIYCNSLNKWLTYSLA